MLAETICKAQKGDEKSTLELLTLFNRLMTRYAYLLEYEDAINDLTLDFIALLKQINTTIFLYKIKPKSDYPLKTLYPRAFQTGQNHLIYYDFTTVE